MPFCATFSIACVCVCVRVKQFIKLPRTPSRPCRQTAPSHPKGIDGDNSRRCLVIDSDSNCGSNPIPGVGSEQFYQLMSVILTLPMIVGHRVPRGVTRGEELTRYGREKVDRGTTPMLNSLPGVASSLTLKSHYEMHPTRLLFSNKRPLMLNERLRRPTSKPNCSTLAQFPPNPKQLSLSGGFGGDSIRLSVGVYVRVCMCAIDLIHDLHNSYRVASGIQRPTGSSSGGFVVWFACNRPPAV